MNDGDVTEAYEAPELIEVGTVQALTQGSSHSSTQDHNSWAGGSTTPTYGFS